MEPSSQEGFHQNDKPPFSSDSSTFIPGGDDDLSGSVSQIRTDDDLTSTDGHDDDMETIERHPVSEISF